MKHFHESVIWHSSTTEHESEKNPMEIVIEPNHGENSETVEIKIGNETSDLSYYVPVEFIPSLCAALLNYYVTLEEEHD